MIYLTGDTHGDFDRIQTFCDRFKTTKDDILIILGDAGINYYGRHRDEYKKQWLEQLPITLFCIHGNHERRPGTIETYRLIPWHGGEVWQEEQYPHILFAKDGDIYDLDGQKAIVLGGAYSIDKYYRLVRGWNWFSDEQPDEAIKAYAEKQLEAAGWKVDIVLSHTTPLKYEPREVFLPGIDQSRVDKSTAEWLDMIEEKLEYEKWYAGHYHTTKKIDRLQIMFGDYDVLDTVDRGGTADV